MSDTTAVVLLQLGGPDGPEAVEPFLYNLFSDPDIIDLPGAFLFRQTLAKFISKRRAPHVQKLYGRIGGGSPILKQTRLQRDRLQESLATRGLKADVYIAMRYWHPLTDEVVRTLAMAKPARIVILPLYPHFSRATTGSGLNAWNRLAKEFELTHVPTEVVQHYFDHPKYIQALVTRIRSALDRIPAEQRGSVHLVFSAHGTPMKLVRDGDPYSHHIRTTYESVVARGNFGLPHTLCFQSKVGPQKWLEPSLTATIERLAHEGVTHMVVVPVAFVTDHIETLSEINIEARQEAIRLGVKYFGMMPALNTEQNFIECLADLILEKCRINTNGSRQT